MTESNPPAQLEELRRRILFYLGEELNRGVDHPHLHAIAGALKETEELTKGQLEILKCQRLVAPTRYHRGALVKLLPKGKLKLEQWGQAAPETDSPPSSETSSESQEFEHSSDYRRVDWRGKRFRFSPMQSHVVRLLHEEFKRGGGALGDAGLLEGSYSTGKYLRDIFRRHCAWGTLIIAGESKGTHKLNLLP